MSPQEHSNGWGLQRAPVERGRPSKPLYKAGGNPSGLDRQYAHKISLVFNPKDQTYYMFYCACGNKGRGIGLIASKPLPAAESRLPGPAGH